MPRKATWLCALVLLLVGINSCGGGSSSSPTVGSGVTHLGYVSVPADNGIFGFRIAGSGNFTSIVGSPFPSGNSPGAMLVHPSNQFLYVVNRSENTVSLFKIDAESGSIAEVLPRTPTGVTPMAMAMTSAGNMLFVLNQLSSSISVFTINSGNGKLAAIAGSPFPAAPNPVAFAMTPSAKFLYVVDSNLALVFAYTISTAGVVQSTGVPVPVGAGPFAIAVDPGEKFVYVANTLDDTVSILSINSATGGLTEVAGSPFDTSVDVKTVTSPISITVSPSGQYVYIANHATSNMTAFSIDSDTGFPTAITGSPFSISSSPVSLVSDPDGQFIYVISQGSPSVSILSMDTSTGAVSTTLTSPSTTTIPVAIAVGK